MASPELKCAVDSRRVIHWLASAVLFFFIASACCQVANEYVGGTFVHGLFNIFDLDTESNLPTYFEALQLLFCSVLLFAAGGVMSEDRFRWRVLALLLFLMSMEEVVGFHEKLMRVIDRFTHFGGFYYFSWTPAGLVFVAAAGLYFGKFLLRLPPRLRYGMALAGLIYVGGALGMEMVDGKYASIYGDHNNFVYDMLTTVEEGLEMAGAACLARTLLLFLGSEGASVTVRFR